MAGEEGFLGENQDSFWDINKRMQFAAEGSTEKFFGESTGAPSLISQESWSKFSSPMSYFLYLSCTYSHLALGSRILRQRPMIECLFQLVILDSALGEVPIKVVLRDLHGGITLHDAFKGKKLVGEQRSRSGLEMLRFCVKVTGGIPKSYADLEEVNRIIKKRSWPALFEALKQQKKTPGEEQDASETEIQLIIELVRSLRESWGIPAPVIDLSEEWIFTES